MAWEIFRVVFVCISVLSVFGLCVLVGHYTSTETSWSLESKELEYMHSHVEEFSMVSHYTNDGVLGFLILFVFCGMGAIIIAIIGFFGYLCYIGLYEYYSSWKKHEDKYDIDLTPENPYFPRGSTRKFVAILLAQSALVCIGLYVLTFPISIVGEWVCKADTAHISHENKHPEGKKAGIIHIALGTFITFVGIIVFSGIGFIIYMVIEEQIKGLKKRWKRHIQIVQKKG